MSASTLEYETPHFLESLLGGDLRTLRLIGDAFGLQTTSRDGWVRLDGPDTGVEQGKTVMRQLEQVRRQGGTVTPAMIRLVIDSVREGRDDRPAERILSHRLVAAERRPPILAKTQGQIDYIRAMHNHEVVFGIGPAGTGKTFLAMAQALHLLREKVVQRLVLTRPAVEAGEALGFLPGDLREKIYPYLRPLYDALYEMVDADEAEKMIERGIVEIAPLAYMRGRTLKNAFVILDEAQNTTTEQMLMFLTRMGEGTRCAVTGDPSQVDLRRNVRSGLKEAVIALQNVEGVSFIQFKPTDVVRLPVVQRIIDAYAAHREKTDPKREKSNPSGKTETNL